MYVDLEWGCDALDAAAAALRLISFVDGWLLSSSLTSGLRCTRLWGEG